MNKTKLKMKAEHFDKSMRAAVERSLKVPFDSLDPTLFTASDLHHTSFLFYDNKVVALIVNHKIYDCNGR